MKKILLLLSFTLTFSCLNNTPVNKIPEHFDYGQVKNGAYRNSFFNIVVPFDKSWKVQSKEQIDQLTDEGLKDVLGESEATKKAIETSKVTTANLFAVFKYDEDSILDEEVDFNPSFIMATENVKGVFKVRTAKDYLDITKDMMKNAQVEYQFENKYGKKTIDGVDFDVLKLESNYEDVRIEQEMYATLKNNFCIIIALTYTNDKDKEELHHMINNITFGSVTSDN